MQRERRRELLQSSPYFAGVGDDVLDRIARDCIVRTYAPGQRLFTEGDNTGSASLHFVANGLIRIFKLSAGGREQVLRLMKPGDSFADVAAFDGGPYPANADSLERSTVLIVPRPVLWSALSEHPEMALGALGIMAARLRHMTGLIEDLSLRRVMSRVAKLLIEHDSSMHLTQSQMATMVGTAREMVNRSLHSLADTGAIELHGSSIVVRDREKLQEVAESG